MFWPNESVPLPPELWLLIAIMSVGLIALEVQSWRRARKRPEFRIVPPTHLDVPMRYGTIGLRTWPTKLAIVDLATNTVLASVDWIPRTGDFVKLTQDGHHFVVSVCSDPDEPDIPILSWTRPSSEHETTR